MPDTVPQNQPWFGHRTWGWYHRMPHNHCTAVQLWPAAETWLDGQGLQQGADNRTNLLAREPGLESGGRWRKQSVRTDHGECSGFCSSHWRPHRAGHVPGGAVPGGCGTHSHLYGALHPPQKAFTGQIFWFGNARLLQYDPNHSNYFLCVRDADSEFRDPKISMNFRNFL